jgi:CRISPR system Cascade subunit CasD
MKEVLLFTLYAPTASWGTIAVGEHRNSWDRPSRSAVLGLVAAALGLRREDGDAHDDLETGYRVAVRLDAPGTPMTDYHTAQTVAESAARRRGVRTRAELLAAGDPETILSRRAYRQDALATAALWVPGEGRWTLAEIAGALWKPAFALYAGRKANPLGFPLAPEVVRADSLAAAFLQRARRHGMPSEGDPAAGDAVSRMRDQLRPRDGWGREVSHDPWDGETGLRPLRRELRRDAIADRTRWLFRERTVQVGLLPVPDGEPTEVHQ